MRLVSNSIIGRLPSLPIKSAAVACVAMTYWPVVSLSVLAWSTAYNLLRVHMLECKLHMKGCRKD